MFNLFRLCYYIFLLYFFYLDISLLLLLFTIQEGNKIPIIMNCLESTYIHMGAYTYHMNFSPAAVGGALIAS